MKARVFIGSSKEGKVIAEHVQLLLSEHFEVTIWNQGVFGISSGTLESLIQSLNKFDFAIIILTPDDMIYSRGIESHSPRDNVLFELGFFLGGLGQKRTFIIHEKGIDIKMPSDLAGITVAQFQPHTERNLSAELGPACTQIKIEIDKFYFELKSEKLNANNKVFWDCSEQEFVDKLVEANSVRIIGITNENLTKYLNVAFNVRQTKLKLLEIIFISRDLMKHYKKPEENDDEAIQRWETGVEDIRNFLSANTDKVNIYSIRHINSIMPFIGQMFDDKWIRVSFILPMVDLKKSCYINYNRDSPPCKFNRNIPLQKLNGLDKDGLPPCKTLSDFDGNCNNCTWNHISCQSLGAAISNLQNLSTPLFAANVVGRLLNRGKITGFVYEKLIPQLGWRQFKDPYISKPAHLCSFVLLYTNDSIILQSRLKENSGESAGEYSLIARKVCDEDFFENQPPHNHRNLVQKMQYSLSSQADYIDLRNNVSFSFSSYLETELKMIPDEPLNNQLLIRVYKRTAIKGLIEKLGINKRVDDLEHIQLDKIDFQIVKHKEYDLYSAVFCLKISTNDLEKINTIRPNSHLISFKIGDFEKQLRDNGIKFGNYLKQYSQPITKLAKDHLLKHSLK